MKKFEAPMTPAADLTRNDQGTGPIRTRIPVYVDLLPPCNNACPAGEDIQTWLALAQDGEYEAAWRCLIADNPMPAIHGRVCYHPCEDSCNRAFIDSPVSIHAVERFLGDRALEKGWKPEITGEPSGKKILIVGGGPSGLSAAYHLTRFGHKVEIHEAGPIAGGMLHFGIPAYRLPRDELNAEINRITDMGVKVHLNHKVEDVIKEKEEGGFDAVFVAIGAHISNKVNIPQRDAGKVLDAVSYLRGVETGNAPKIGRRVAIYGGGNTAMDVARTAKRMGADEALIIYRRDRENMPAHDFEATEALEEGIKINWLRTIKEIDATEFKVEVMEIGDDGKPHSTGKFETLEADNLILALGQKTETAFLQGIEGMEFYDDGTVVVGPNMMTGCEGIFAGGDMVPSERTVTIAVGHGKKAARFIDGYLREKPYIAGDKHPIVGYERLRMWYRTHAAQKSQEQLPIVERTSFDEITQGLPPSDALFEASRCLSCGNCFECDGCYGSCPEDAIIKLGPGKKYEYNYDKCTGCAVCYEQCPCHAIEMVTEGVSE
ncbi:MAG: NAD(P)-binding protein [Kordiimonadaceae bacterium]|jgi:formate dehydrogenase (NADP+) beta subunit|nr:NAD(P)-binding protein [Kordiimonadaceae bacterium]